MADQAMAAVDYLVLGFLLLGSRHNEVAMSRRHERRPGGPIKYSRYISSVQCANCALHYATSQVEIGNESKKESLLPLYKL